MPDCRSSFDVRRSSRALITALLVGALTAGSAAAQQTQTQTPFEPQVGQPGKDVVWVPTAEALVEKMLDLAKITPQDFVMDLGSGDGRNVIAAAKRGARAVGVEYNPQMVELSRASAKKAGVADRATFIEGDMYEADVSKATALVLFLLPVNLEKLTPKFLDMKPGTRIVDNTFRDSGLGARRDRAARNRLPDVVLGAALDRAGEGPGQLAPAGWRDHVRSEIPDGHRLVKTASGAAQIESGKLNGEEITFTAGGTQYTGKVNGDRIEGTARTGSNLHPWSATRGK